jgi:formate dehydrogenase major subunit
MVHSDCVVFQDSNMAECHPVAFRWPMQAKLNGAKLIHVDPCFTRTSAMCDLHVPIRAGSDIAFLDGLVNYVLNSERWNSDAFFRDYLLNYTNAATIIHEAFQDAEDLYGTFSGLHPYTVGSEAWPFNGFQQQYDDATWQYARGGGGSQGWTASTSQSGEQAVQSGEQPTARAVQGPPFDALVQSLRQPSIERDDTLQDPRTVFQLLKRHYSRYTPEIVAQVTGCPQDIFLQAADTILANSDRDRTTAWAFAELADAVVEGETHVFDTAWSRSPMSSLWRFLTSLPRRVAVHNSTRCVLES